MSDSMQDAALELAAIGWRVFPLLGKQPLTEHGFHDATTDPERVRFWWTGAPDANIGIAVPSGMVVVDVDPRDGGDRTLAELERQHGRLPRTLTTITGSGGEHRWYKRVTDGLRQQNLGRGVQTRVGGRGYVVAPPSVHPDTGRPYEWSQPLAPVACLPEWVAARLRPAERQTGGATLRVIAGDLDDVAGFLRWAADRVRCAPEGQRHDRLRNTARLAGGRLDVSEEEAVRVLLGACASWGTPRKDEATIRSAFQNGRLEPVS